MQDDAKDIIQIMPSGGWHFAYKESDGTPVVFPVLAWGLTREGDVVALDCDACGVVDDVTDLGNFVCLGPSHKATLDQFWVQQEEDK